MKKKKEKGQKCFNGELRYEGNEAGRAESTINFCAQFWIASRLAKECPKELWLKTRITFKILIGNL